MSLHQEVENYRSAMSKMAEDIIALRTQVVTLEAENSQLRTDLSLQQDLGRDLLDDTDIDVMTKAEIADRIGNPQQALWSNYAKAIIDILSPKVEKSSYSFMSESLLSSQLLLNLQSMLWCISLADEVMMVEGGSLCVC